MEKTKRVGWLQPGQMAIEERAAPYSGVLEQTMAAEESGLPPPTDVVDANLVVAGTIRVNRAVLSAEAHLG